MAAMPSSTTRATEVFETGPFPLLSQKGKALKAKCLLKTKHKHVLLKTVPQKMGLIYSGSKSGYPTSFSCTRTTADKEIQES